MSKRPQVMRKLRLDHIARVDRGANQHAHVMLAKRAPLPEDPADGGPVAKGAGADAFHSAKGGQDAMRNISQLIDACYQHMDALRQAIGGITGDDKVSDKPGAIKEAATAALASLRNHPAFGGGKKKAADPTGTEKGAGPPPAPGEATAAGGDGANRSDPVDPNKTGAAGSEPGTGTQKGEKVELVQISKADLDALREATEVAKALKGQVDTLKADLDAQRQATSTEVEKRLEVEWAQKAEAELPYMGGSPTAKGRILRGLRKRMAAVDKDGRPTPDAAAAGDELAVLKGADAAARQLYTTVGKHVAKPAEGAGDIDAAIEAAGQEIAKRDGIPLGDARRKVATERPELWDAKYQRDHAPNGRA